MSGLHEVRRCLLRCPLLLQLHVRWQPCTHLLLADLLPQFLGWHLEMRSFDGAIFIVQAVGVCRVRRVLVEDALVIVLVGHVVDAASDVAVLVLPDLLDFLFIFIRAFKNLQSVRDLRLVKTLRVADCAQ